jgi:hypothetical protein
VVTVKESEKARLSASRSLDATETYVFTRTLEIAQIPEQFLSPRLILSNHKFLKKGDKTDLKPERRPFADSGQLRRLKVREPKRWQGAIFLCEFSEAIDDNREFVDEQREGLADED